jgi:hypothetical protein
MTLADLPRRLRPGLHNAVHLQVVETYRHGCAAVALGEFAGTSRRFVAADLPDCVVAGQAVHAATGMGRR